MSAPINRFKQALHNQQPQIGLWLALANPYSAEICGGAGFDWLLLDGEHAPNDVPLLMQQLQALAASPAHTVVRAPMDAPWLIKQLLDIGAQTLLIPMVESAAQAQALVKAVRYPPQGIRGVGAALARASAFNRTPDYLTSANAQICLLVQVESRAGLAQLDAIATIDGVDGVFIGPADLAADMGFPGKPGAPEVQEVVEAALVRIQFHGKAAGILSADPRLCARYLELGATFVAVGSDVGLLVKATSALAADFR
ncbi:4-hydroxy-2-oxoheptanedioate aldolase [Pantoea phytobeneficialis]|uniref:2,4-dihydroxyhept-2-ene-1,7-dioic acid aldolase n=1 Tax=Pantoea phytobeneficialis TaxID=2052056 RepID=A0AAP9H5F8_9GAMM|nr:4-hydroxy-2-oxoheptanedioate aldolase [Pantoea phytobeneficialis]MDO6405684.1 4-hydroxy-2-oxoheptanedioate aldolase [Pantoea phytobeneficialis]QGR06676.1 2,4-dihydroxyhept-2-ene-1,7-dioic acid aldolase [Pantoea phytobeneficialis]